MIPLGAKVEDNLEGETVLHNEHRPAPWAHPHLVFRGGTPQLVDGRLRLRFPGPEAEFEGK